MELSASARPVYYELMSAERSPDVPADQWAFDEIGACAAAGIVSGYRDGFYRPVVLVCRDQTAVYIARSFDLPM